MFVVLVLALVSMKLAEGQVIGLNAVVDLSHWNTNVDFVRAKADGIKGIFHKATQGLGYVDPQYITRKEIASNLGLLWGAYHFANGSCGVDQAKHFLNVIGDDLETILALDVEENPSGPTVNLTIAEDFVTTVYEATGRYPFVYGSPLFLKNLIAGNKSVLLDCPLWLANWSNAPHIPENTWTNWTLWQYTDGNNGPSPHSVDGIGPCDRDSINTGLFDSEINMWRNIRSNPTDVK